MANDKTYNVASLFLIFAALLSILSFLGGWVVISLTGLSGGTSIWTGYSILDSLARDNFGGISFIPLFVMILGIITLLVAFLPKIGLNLSAPKYCLILLILGFAILILDIVFMISTFTYDEQMFKVFEHLGVGEWMTLVSGIIVIFIGILAPLTRRI